MTRQKKEQRTANSTLPKVAVSCFVGQFCGYINFSASYENLCWKSPPSASCKTLCSTSRNKISLRVWGKSINLEISLRIQFPKDDDKQKTTWNKIELRKLSFRTKKIRPKLKWQPPYSTLTNTENKTQFETLNKWISIYLRQQFWQILTRTPWSLCDWERRSRK